MKLSHAMTQIAALIQGSLGMGPVEACSIPDQELGTGIIQVFRVKLPLGWLQIGLFDHKPFDSRDIHLRPGDMSLYTELVLEGKPEPVDGIVHGDLAEVSWDLVRSEVRLMMSRFEVEIEAARLGRNDSEAED